MTIGGARRGWDLMAQLGKEAWVVGDKIREAGGDDYPDSELQS